MFKMFPQGWVPAHPRVFVVASSVSVFPFVAFLGIPGLSRRIARRIERRAVID
jgi:hypothetical protein